MQDAWLAFARSGDPNHAGIPRWHAYSVQGRATMVFEDTIHEVADPYREERMAWEKEAQTVHPPADYAAGERERLKDQECNRVIPGLKRQP